MRKPARFNTRRAQKATSGGGLSGHLDIASDPAFATPFKTDPLAEPIKWSLWRNRARREEIRVTLCRFNDRPIGDIRIFFTTADGRMQASKKGVAIDVARLPALADMLAKAVEKARQLGLLEMEAKS
ncbi:transcriptional coactivator p15/PC4 family protein [Bradyrhizobium lupini]|uniref:transcriptional coactivator p15/PC4 family protein n=1 Tax=Rhizobium lupini TaxID=136996 RepID=UPI00366F5BB6